MLPSIDIVGWYTPILYICLALSGSLLLIFYFIVPRSSIKNLQGPPPQSWLIGNMRELESEPVGACEFRWMEEYGHTYRIKGGFGEDVLFTSDPKALQFLLQTSSYNITKNPFQLQRTANLLGDGSILSVEGNVHKRHRKVMLPAFGFPETKALTHIFQEIATKLVGQWKGEMKDFGSFETNVHRWLARATLDAIGEAAFDYQFGAMDNQDNKLGNTYRDMFVFIAARPSKFKVAWNNFTNLLNRPLAKLTDVPTKSKKWVLTTRGIARDVAAKLLDEKWSVSDGVEEGKRDVMSLLVKANNAENERTRLTRQEVIDQMGALILAGHETTSNTLAWSLWELAKNPAIQNKLRSEVESYCQSFSSPTIPVTEYDGMKYTVAFIKEVLRMYPIVPKLLRQANKDLLVPLHSPTYDKNGQRITHITLKKGMRMFGNLVGYNRHPDLWGADPHVFRPERWFEMDEKKEKVKFGVYGNMAIFGAGIHACIGWRFALYELQSFLIALIQNFEFELPDNAPKVRRTFAGVMVPQVEGDEQHVSMPLKISILKN